MRWSVSARDAAKREDVPRNHKFVSDISDAREVLELAEQLRSTVSGVSLEEFYWQEATMITTPAKAASSSFLSQIMNGYAPPRR